MTTRIALFDIDHTLVDVLAYHERAYSATMSAVFAVAADLHDIEFSGKTTPRILRELAIAAGRPRSEVDARLPEALELFSRLVLAGLDDDLAEQVLPGIPELLACLRSRGIVLGIVTGNPKLIGSAVLKRSGLDRWFAACAFGTEASERWELVRLAVERTARAARLTVRPSEVVVVGDSPHDIAAGKAYGTRTVAFQTGLTPASKLADARPDYLFPNASDYEAVCAAIAAGLPPGRNGPGPHRSDRGR